MRWSPSVGLNPLAQLKTMPKMQSHPLHLHQVVDLVLDRRLLQLLAGILDAVDQQPRMTVKPFSLLRGSSPMSTRMLSLLSNAAAPEGLNESRVMMMRNSKTPLQIPLNQMKNFSETLILLHRFRSCHRRLQPTGSALQPRRSLEQLLQSQNRTLPGSDCFRDPDPVTSVTNRSLNHLLNLLHQRQFPLRQLRRELQIRSEEEPFPEVEGFPAQGLISMPCSRF